MIILKLGLLTCAFYVALTLLLEVGIWARAYFGGGFGIFVAGKSWFWGMGLWLGVIFGLLWVISFGAAWCIIYASFKAKLPVLPS
jgi:hypothetical protein